MKEVALEVKAQVEVVAIGPWMIRGLIELEKERKARQKQELSLMVELVLDSVLRR